MQKLVTGCLEKGNREDVEWDGRSFYLHSCFSYTIAHSSPQEEEEAGFTGRRMNSKMQVYSGSKCAYLPKMMTLHQQCIRVLKNNIDCKSHASLLLSGMLWHWDLTTEWLGCYSVLSPLISAAIFEVGGVPYSVLEPVLERCTPEQLYRIEEYNHVSILFGWKESSFLASVFRNSFVFVNLL